MYICFTWKSCDYFIWFYTILKEVIIIVNLKTLEGLSFQGAKKYLEEAGYKEGETLNLDSDECDVLLIFTYLLCNDNGKIIDKVGHAEYCMVDLEGDLEDFKCEWIRLE